MALTQKYFGRKCEDSLLDLYLALLPGKYHNLLQKLYMAFAPIGAPSLRSLSRYLTAKGITQEQDEARQAAEYILTILLLVAPCVLLHIILYAVKLFLLLLVAEGETQVAHQSSVGVVS